MTILLVLSGLLAIYGDLFPCWIPTLQTISQTKTGVLKYHHIQGIGDTLRRSTTPYELRFTQTESAVVTIGNTKQVRAIQDTSVRIISPPLFQTRIHKNRNVNKLTSRELAFNKRVIVVDTLEELAWDIKNQTKLIGAYLCQKAEVDYYGRHYVAWFTPEIPVSDGPWKLHGLPGLILEAEDSKRELIFEFASLTLPIPEDNAQIQPIVPTEKQKVLLSMKDFNTFLKETIRNYENMSNSDPKYPNSTIKIGWQSIEIFPN
jgi:GLPGLI family protein